MILDYAEIFMKKVLLPAVALLAVIAGYWFATTLQRERAPAANHPGEMIAFRLPDLAGQPHDIAEWKGKVLVLNFWATWCPPCREEIPAFQELQERYGAQGLQFVGVAIDERTAVIDFRDAMFVSYPLLIGENDAMEIMTRYGNNIGALPYTVVMDRNGRIVATRKGAYRGPELEAVVRPLL